MLKGFSPGAALLFLIGFRYAVVEREDTLPEEVRFGLTGWGDIASAEVEKESLHAEIPEEAAEPAEKETDALPEEPAEEEAEEAEETGTEE
jgi:hypothetical protein